MINTVIWTLIDEDMVTLIVAYCPHVYLILYVIPG